MNSHWMLVASLLATLAAEGAAFDRAVLNRMLSALEKSIIPKKLGIGATCYDMVALPQVRTEFICPKCGARTYYPRHLMNELRDYRSRCEELRKLGLDITIDETPYCAKCSTDKKNFISELVPVSAVVTGKDAGLPVGTRVQLQEKTGDFYSVAIDTLWVRTKDLKGNELKPDYRLYAMPEEEKRIKLAASFSCFEAAVPDKADPEGWRKVRVKKNYEDSYIPTFSIEGKKLGDIKKMELSRSQECTLPNWVIRLDGKIRTIPVQNMDFEIMQAFLTKKDKYDGYTGAEYALKNELPRLRLLLGEDVKP